MLCHALNKSNTTNLISTQTDNQHWLKLNKVLGLQKTMALYTC